MEKFDKETEKAIKHVEFCTALYKYQVQQGRHFLHEHPWTARSWKLECVDELLKTSRSQHRSGPHVPVPDDVTR
jgi:hypothetical protein